MQAAESALWIEPRGQLPALEQYAAPSQLRYEKAGSSSRRLPGRGHRAGAAADALDPSVNPAELAQACIFNAILQTEFARLTELASRVGGPLDRFRRSGGGQENRELMHVDARIDEVRRLLGGLRDRFGLVE